MPGYLFAYKGGTWPSEEDLDGVLEAWSRWWDELGPAVADQGRPFSDSRTVGASGDSSDLKGYSVITADNLDAAVALTAGCPHLDAGGAIEVYEPMNETYERFKKIDAARKGSGEHP